MKLLSRVDPIGVLALLLMLGWGATPAALAAAPTAYAGWDRTVILTGTSVTVPFTGATANDADGLAGLTYAWTPATGTGIASWTARTGSVGTPSAPAAAQVTLTAPGTYTFMLTVTDPTLLSTGDQVIIYVLRTPVTSVYDPPANYYDAACPGGVWYTGSTLKTALRSIISTSIVERSYDLARQSLQILDLDLNNSNNVILIYTGASVLKTWDSGSTWNREHLWPQSLFNNDPSVEGEEFNLRPCNPSVNSARGNTPYGIGGGYWDPDQGAPDRGIVSRAMFFMETRYSQLTLVNGQPGSLQMGDLASMRTWHYQYPVTVGERRRNHLVYSSVDNPSYFQGNRNPYVDYPELVWAIWGTTPSDAKLYVSDTAPADGASLRSVDVGRVIVGGPLWPAQSVVLHKNGTIPATYAVNITGAAASNPLSTRQSFPGGTQALIMQVGLIGPTTTAGTISGDVTIDNTELTSSGTGCGSADGDDVIAVDGDVLAHAQASFNAAADQNTLTIDFGTVSPGTGPHTQPVTIYNLVVVSGYTAGLALIGIAPAGDYDVLHADFATFSNLAPGSGAPFTATLDANAPAGTYTTTYTLSVADEALPGQAAGTSLVLTLTAEVGSSPSICRGDTNCDGFISYADINPFVLALNDPSTWQAQHPGCPAQNLDTNADDDFTYADINPFVVLLGNPGPCP